MKILAAISNIRHKTFKKFTIYFAFIKTGLISFNPKVVLGCELTFTRVHTLMYIHGVHVYFRGLHRVLVVYEMNENPWHADRQFLRPTLRVKP